MGDRKSTRLNSSHTEIYTLSLHDALPISAGAEPAAVDVLARTGQVSFEQHPTSGTLGVRIRNGRSEERRVGKECRSLCDWSSDVCSSDLSGCGTGSRRCARSDWAGLLRAAPDFGNARREDPEWEIGRASCRERV